MGHMLHPHRSVRRHPTRPDAALIDRLAGTVGILVPFFTIPQILDIWKRQSAEGVSAFSWVGYLAFSVFWLVYALYHKDRPLIALHVLWIVMQLAVVVGIFVYS
jgi:uncharacterized protein with PQ loop repeat